MNQKNDKFWLNNINILFDRYIEFFPTSDQSINEILNSLTRFVIYSGILSFLYTHNINTIYFSIVLIFFIIFVHFYNSESNLEHFSNYNCTEPTYNNPFMNVLLSDYNNNPNRPPACQSYSTLTHNGVADDIEEKFSYNLYNDVGSLYGKNNSQRQYYTMPSTTIPNAQTEFAQWLYGDAKSCKDDPFDCVPYERLQQKRNEFPQAF